jgi:hypothetical protein
MEFNEYRQHWDRIYIATHVLQQELRDYADQYIATKTSFRRGDKVKYVIKGDSYYNEPDQEYQGEIYAFDVRPDGRIITKIGHDNVPIDDLTYANERKAKIQSFLTEEEDEVS